MPNMTALSVSDRYGGREKSTFKVQKCLQWSSLASHVDLVQLDRNRKNFLSVALRIKPRASCKLGLTYGAFPEN